MRLQTCDTTLPLDITAASTDVYCTAADSEYLNIVGVGVDADVFDEVFVSTVLEEDMKLLLMVFVGVFMAAIVVRLPLLFFKVIVLMLVMWVVGLLIRLVESVIMVVVVLLRLVVILVVTGGAEMLLFMVMVSIGLVTIGGKVIEDVIDDVDLVALVDVFTGTSDIIFGVVMDVLIIAEISDVVFALYILGTKVNGVCKSEIIQKVSTNLI